MGFIISKAWDKLLGRKKDVRMLMVGLDASGKTTVLYNLKTGETIKTIPTIGFNVESLDYKGLNFTVWDIGGQYAIRKLWKHYYNNSDGIIFVIDSADVERIEEAVEELRYLMNEEELKDCPLLIIANKQDLLGALSPNELTKKLGLDISKRAWLVQGASAISGQGLKEGFDWMASTLLKKK
jgi:small GTP-binding protein